VNKILKKLKKKRYMINEVKKLKENSDEKKIIMFGSPEHGNLGDHAISKGELTYFRENFGQFKVHDITGPIYRKNRDKIKKYIKDDDIIIITGGGFLGSLWESEEKMARNIIEDYKKNQIIIFPSTIYFENNEDGREEYLESQKIYNSHSTLKVVAREGQTEKVLNRMFYENKPERIISSPDIALYLNEEKEVTRKGVLLCFRGDKERVSDGIMEGASKKINELGIKFKNIDTVIPKEVLIHEREEELQKLFDEFRRSKLVITDRLHGMVIAAITGTPCIAFDNLSGKVSGVYKWVEDIKYIEFLDSIDNLDTTIDHLLNLSETKYPVLKIREQFKELTTAIEKIVE